MYVCLCVFAFSQHRRMKALILKTWKKTTTNRTCLRKGIMTLVSRRLESILAFHFQSWRDRARQKIQRQAHFKRGLLQLRRSLTAKMLRSCFAKWRQRCRALLMQHAALEFRAKHHKKRFLKAWAEHSDQTSDVRTRSISAACGGVHVRVRLCVFAGNGFLQTYFGVCVCADIKSCGNEGDIGANNTVTKEYSRLGWLLLENNKLQGPCTNSEFE